MLFFQVCPEFPFENKMNYEKPQGTSSLSSLNLDLSFGGSKTMPTTQSKQPAGFGMGQTAPPIVPGRPYDWTIKPGERNYLRVIFRYADSRVRLI